MTGPAPEVGATGTRAVTTYTYDTATDGVTPINGLGEMNYNNGNLTEPPLSYTTSGTTRRDRRGSRWGAGTRSAGPACSISSRRPPTTSACTPTRAFESSSGRSCGTAQVLVDS